MSLAKKKELLGKDPIMYSILFSDAKSMLDLVKGDSYYNIITGKYVTSDEKGICVYDNIPFEVADLLSSFGYSDWCYLLNEDSATVYSYDNALAWCEKNNDMGWIEVEKYLENCSTEVNLFEYEIRYLIDNQYHVNHFRANTAEKAKEKLLSRIDTAKEYEILSVEKMGIIKELQTKIMFIPSNDDITTVLWNTGNGYVISFALTGQGDNINYKKLTGIVKVFPETSLDTSISEMTAGEIISSMNESEKNSLYHMLWSDRVYNDVETRLDDREISLDEDEKEAFIMEVVNRYVYNVDYDCNLSYWDNIDNLINEELEGE